MTNDDLLDHAKSDKDFYALLGEVVHEGSTDKEIARAYRRSALKSHPDQNPDDPAAAERFHLLQIAYDVLSDPAAREAYNNARAARRLRRRQDELLYGKRRAMKEDLERRESGVFKRKRDDLDAEEKFEMEIRRLAEDGKRRRMERVEAVRREAAAAAAAKKQEAEASQRKQESAIAPLGGTSVPEISRTVKVRWAREGRGSNVDKERLEALFRIFGKIEGVVVMPDRKMRLADERKKRKIATGVIIYASIVGAHAAVEDLTRQTGEEWSVFEKIEWAEGKEPELWRANGVDSAQPAAPETGDAAPSTPQRPPSSLPKRPHAQNSTPSTPHSTFAAKFPHPDSAGGAAGGLRKVPSYASFRSANGGTPLGSPFGTGADSPSLEEITMIRLKKAEKKRLEEQIRRQEQEGLESADG